VDAYNGRKMRRGRRKEGGEWLGKKGKGVNPGLGKLGLQKEQF